MRFHIHTAAIMILGASAVVHAEEGFENLFNGKDLSGWKNVNCAPETWSVTNGMIHCTGRPTGELRTTRQYENFILELDWRHLKPAGNAGVFVWAGPISATGQPFLRAIEVQVLDHGFGNTKSHTTHGDVFPIHGSKMKPHGRSNGMRSFPSEERSKPSPEWNHYRIECNDGVLRLHVNGKEVSGGSECDWRKGYIALESEGSPVDFKNIRIKELPSTGATKEQSAPEWRGFESLYTGTDLRGWTTKPADEKLWKSRDWRLGYSGEPDYLSTLQSNKKYGDFELIYDWKLGEGGRTSLQMEGAVPQGFAPDTQQGGWHRTHVVREGATVTVTIDGGEAKVSTLTDSPADKRRWIGLMGRGSVEYAGVYILDKSK